MSQSMKSQLLNLLPSMSFVEKRDDGKMVRRRRSVVKAEKITKTMGQMFYEQQCHYQGQRLIASVWRTSN